MNSALPWRPETNRPSRVGLADRGFVLVECESLLGPVYNRAIAQGCDGRRAATAAYTLFVRLLWVLNT